MEEGAINKQHFKEDKGKIHGLILWRHISNKQETIRVKSIHMSHSE